MQNKRHPILENYTDPFMPFSEHAPEDNIPFLREPVNQKVLEINPHTISIMVKDKDQRYVPENKLMDIQKNVTSLLELSYNDYAENRAAVYSPDIMQIPEKNKLVSDTQSFYEQKGLFAKADIPALTVIGIYAGHYINSLEELEFEYKKSHPVLAGRYMNACDREGFPAISAYMCGNYMSYINDWRPFDGDHSVEQLIALKDEKQNVISLIGNDGRYKFIFYVAIQDIPKNTEILTDYGQGYWDNEADIKSRVIEQMIANQGKQ